LQFPAGRQRTLSGESVNRSIRAPDSSGNARERSIPRSESSIPILNSSVPQLDFSDPRLEISVPQPDASIPQLDFPDPRLVFPIPRPNFSIPRPEGERPAARASPTLDRVRERQIELCNRNARGREKSITGEPPEFSDRAGEKQTAGRSFTAVDKHR